MLIETRKGETFIGESTMDNGVLLLALRLRITRETLGWSQAKLAEKLALTLDQVKKLEEGEHGPDTEKTLAMLDAGFHFKRSHALTWIQRDFARKLFPKNGEEE